MQKISKARLYAAVVTFCAATSWAHAQDVNVTGVGQSNIMETALLTAQRSSTAFAKDHDCKDPILNSKMRAAALEAMALRRHDSTPSIERVSVRDYLTRNRLSQEHMRELVRECAANLEKQEK